MRRKVPRVAGNDAGPRPTLHRRRDLFGASSHPGRTSSTAGRVDGRGPLRALTRLSPEGTLSVYDCRPRDLAGAMARLISVE
jgi:hypothetical protein